MKFVEMRKELLGYLEGLSDLDYQNSCWVKGECPKGIEHDELDYTVHFLFDDTTLSSEPDEWIGLCLRNHDEAESIKKICRKMKNVFDKYGYSLTDAEYIALPEWKEVVNAAISSKKYFK